VRAPCWWSDETSERRNRWATVGALDLHSFSPRKAAGASVSNADATTVGAREAHVEMYARAVDDAGSRLRDLRREEWSELGLAALAVGLALLATQTMRDLAIPLFVGGLVIAFRGMIAAWSRWEIVDRLAGEPDAYVIPEVRKHALQEASIERRRLYAASVRYALRTAAAGEFGAATSELESLVAELEDVTLTLDASCAVACARLVSDPYRRALLNPSATPNEVRSQVQHIRAGFARRESI